MKESRRILHFDGDSFFASVEQVLNYKYKGKPLVTGSERGVITSASIEAKRLGIGRGISMHDAKEMCPGLIIVPGNYLMYSIFARRMYAIVREFTEKVEEYSIDECFADVTGFTKDVGQEIKERLEASLGVTFGVGYAPTKVLAKVASKHRKPGGYKEIIKEETRREILADLPCGKVWGIGPSGRFLLLKLGVKTALAFADKDKNWLDAHKIPKPLREIWYELNGISVKELNLLPEPPLSLVKSRTFRPSSSDRAVVFSELSRNVELAAADLRKQKLKAKAFRFYLKTQEFRYVGFEVNLPIATSSPVEMLKYIREHFSQVYRPRTVYRATGIALRSFERDVPTPDLFGLSAKEEKQAAVFKAVDAISRKFGNRSVILVTSLKAGHSREERPKKHLDLPFLGKAR